MKFSLFILSLVFADYKEIKELGSGSFGRVLLIQNANNGELIAMKKTLIDNRSKSEIAALKKMRDSIYSVNLYEVKESRDGHFFILLEYIRGRTLQNYLDTQILNFRMKHRIASKLLQALVEMNERNVRHSDLKPGNIIIDNALKPRIIDFGCARIETSNDQSLKNLCYSHMYSPLTSADRMQNYDVYSFGVILLVMFSDFNADEVVRHVHDAAFFYGPAIKNASFLNEAQEYLPDLLSKILGEHFQDRMDLIDIMSHPFFAYSNLNKKGYFFQIKISNGSQSLIS